MRDYVQKEKFTKKTKFQQCFQAIGVTVVLEQVAPPQIKVASPQNQVTFYLTILFFFIALIWLLYLFVYIFSICICSVA